MPLSPQAQKLIDEYLGRLEQGLSAWSPSDKADLLAELRSHLDEALVRIGRNDEAAVAQALQQLGAPEQWGAASSASLEERLHRLEALTGVSLLQSKPGFDPARFLRVLNSYLAWVYVPMFFSFIAVPFVMRQALDVVSSNPGSVMGVPLVAINSVGIVSVGGLAIGLLAMGGGAIGVIATGGGAVGVIAIGGGAIGLVALGGASFGYVAMGGGAFGVYVLGERGRGRFVFTLERQDDEAIRFFTRFLPRLRTAFAA